MLQVKKLFRQKPNPLILFNHISKSRVIMGFKNNIRSKITISFTTTKKDDVPETTENVTTGNNTNASTTAKKALKKTKITKKSKKKLASKKIKLTFRKVTGAKKYVVQVSTSKKFKKVLYKKVVRKTKATLSSKKIKNKKKLYVRVKAVGASKWSKPARIKR